MKLLMKLKNWRKFRWSGKIIKKYTDSQDEVIDINIQDESIQSRRDVCVQAHKVSKTDDSTNIMLWMGLLMLSGSALLIAKKKRAYMF